MAAYYTSQAYDAPASLIWSILTDFSSWPRWFPNVSGVEFENGHVAGAGATLLAVGDDRGLWTRWRIVEWIAPSRLVCEHLHSNTPVSGQVQAAYLQFQIEDDPDGCTLEVELGAEGYGLMGDLFVGMTLGTGARRILPQLVDAFTVHVIAEVREMQR